MSFFVNMSRNANISECGRINVDIHFELSWPSKLSCCSIIQLQYYVLGNSALLMLQGCCGAVATSHVHQHIYQDIFFDDSLQGMFLC